MKRPLGLTLLVLFVSLVRPAPASAGFWAWLEEWSGPGPFRGYTFLFTACVQDRKPRTSPIAPNDEYHLTQERLAKSIKQQLTTPPDNRLPTAVIFRRLLANPDPSYLQNRLALLTELTPATKSPASGKSRGPDSSATSDVTSKERVASTAPSEGGKPVGDGNRAPHLTLKELPDLYKNPKAEDGPRHDDQRLTCGYVDQGLFHVAANPERGFPSIHAHLTDFGPSVRLHDGVDLGAGVGWVSFSGKSVNGNPRLTLTPFRLIVRPITMAVPEVYRKRYMGLLSIYWKETFVGGRLTGVDFGSAEDAFFVKGELIRSFGFNLDITALFPARWDLRTRDKNKN